METFRSASLVCGLALLAGCPDDTKAPVADPQDTGETATYDSYDEMYYDTCPHDSASEREMLATSAWIVTASPTGATFGVEMYPYDHNSNTWDSSKILCHADTAYVPTDPYKECATCEFSYSYVGTAEGALSGDYCEQFGATAGGDDGYGMGLGATSNYADYGITAIYLYLASYPDYEWFTFTLDYGPVYSATISGDSLSGTRIRVDQNTGYPVYYSYTP